MQDLKPRIMMVSHSAQCYGAELSLVTLADELQRKGLAQIVVLVPKAGPLITQLASRGIEYQVVRYYEWISYSWGRLKLLKRLLKLPLTFLGLARAFPWARRWNPDLIYINTVACPMGLILATVLGRPYIWHIREWIGPELNTRFDLGHAAVMWLLNRSKTEIIYNSNSIADIYAPYVTTAKSVVVYNGFDFSGLNKPDARRKYEESIADVSTIRLAVVGSVHTIKGQEDAVRAVAILWKQGISTKLEIMGTGAPEYIANLRKLTEELGVAEKIIFRGYVADAIDSLDGIAAVLVPSLYEPFGRVAVEAQSRGIPVVAAATGGLKEIIIDGKTGLLFTPGEPSALAEKLAILLGNRKLYESFIDEAWMNVTQRFTQQKYLDGVWSVMKKVISAEC